MWEDEESPMIEMQVTLLDKKVRVEDWQEEVQQQKMQKASLMPFGDDGQENLTEELNGETGNDSELMDKIVQETQEKKQEAFEAFNQTVSELIPEDLREIQRQGTVVRKGQLEMTFQDYFSFRSTLFHESVSEKKRRGVGADHWDERMIKNSKITYVSEMHGFFLLPEDKSTVFYVFPKEYRDVFAQFHCNYGYVFTLFEPYTEYKYREIKVAQSRDIPVLFVNQINSFKGISELICYEEISKIPRPGLPFKRTAIYESQEPFFFCLLEESQERENHYKFIVSTEHSVDIVTFNLTGYQRQVERVIKFEPTQLKYIRAISKYKSYVLATSWSFHYRKVDEENKDGEEQRMLKKDSKRDYLEVLQEGKYYQFIKEGEGAFLGSLKVLDQNFKTIFEIDIEMQQLKAFRFLDYDIKKKTVDLFFNSQILTVPVEELESVVAGVKVKRTYFIVESKESYFIYSPQNVIQKTEEDEESRFEIVRKEYEEGTEPSEVRAIRFYEKIGYLPALDFRTLAIVLKKQEQIGFTCYQFQEGDKDGDEKNYVFFFRQDDTLAVSFKGIEPDSLVKISADFRSPFNVALIITDHHQYLWNNGKWETLLKANRVSQEVYLRYGLVYIVSMKNSYHQFRCDTMDHYVHKGDMKYSFLNDENVAVWSQITHRVTNLSQLIRVNQGLVYIHYCMESKGMIDEFEVMTQYVADDVVELIRSNEAFWAALYRPSQNIKIKEYFNFTFIDMNSHREQEICWKDGSKLKMKLKTRTPNHAQAFIDGVTEALFLWNLPFSFPVEFDFEIEVQDFKYSIKAGAKGILLLVKVSPYESPEGYPENIVDYINNFVYYKSRVTEGSIFPINQKINTLLKNPTTFYDEIMRCDPPQLGLYLINSFGSIGEINAQFSSRFLVNLVELFSVKLPDMLGIFQYDLFYLMSLARDSDLTLQQFFASSFQRVDQLKVRVDNPVLVNEYPTTDVIPFKEELKESKGPHQVVVNVYRSRYQLPPQLTKASLYFLEHLYDMHDLELFEIEGIQNYISKRWKRARYYFWGNGLALLIGLLFLFLHTSFWRIGGLLVPVLLLSFSELVIEVIQFTGNRRRYLLTFWNWLDIFRILFTVAYFVVFFIREVSQDDKRILLTFLNMVYCFKLFSLFSLHPKTRVLLRIVIEIIVDMIPFISFCIASTLFVALFFTSAIREDDVTNSSYSDFLLQVFLLDFGEFGDMEFNRLEWFIFIIAVLFVPLIMLNMLIAIMGDTYDRVKEESLKRDKHEITYLLYEYELVGRVCGCKRDRRAKYLFFSKEKVMNLQNSITWEGRIKAIKQEVVKVREDVQVILDKKFAQMDRSIEKIQAALVKKLEQKFDQISDKSQNVQDSPIDLLIQEVLKSK